MDSVANGVRLYHGRRALAGLLLRWTPASELDEEEAVGDSGTVSETMRSAWWRTCTRPPWSRWSCVRSCVRSIVSARGVVINGTTGDSSLSARFAPASVVSLRLGGRLGLRMGGAMTSSWKMAAGMTPCMWMLSWMFCPHSASVCTGVLKRRRARSAKPARSPTKAMQPRRAATTMAGDTRPSSDEVSSSLSVTGTVSPATWRLRTAREAEREPSAAAARRLDSAVRWASGCCGWEATAKSTTAEPAVMEMKMIWEEEVR
mmetsp:Transcript_25595/g.55441  ORF Transcript_25595/g.55441 Transcript_25595/m.55441 type:complete len:260 (-) Transcript_25595:2026-2805(-)